MKKTLLALACASMATLGAHAQSSVEIYGVMDLWVGNAKNNGSFNDDATAIGAPGVTQVANGGLGASRLGFRGTEDLGGGLKVMFVAEQRLDPVNGNGLTGGDRQSFLGLSGSFGTVTLGNSFTAYDNTQAGAFANFDSALTPEYFVFASAQHTSNPTRQFTYESPEFSGFTFGFSRSIDGSRTLNAGVTAYSLTYANGPLTAVLAYQSENVDLPVLLDSTASANSDKLSFTRLGATYDLGVADLKISLGRGSEGDLKARDISIGADFPISEALTLSAGYARSTDKFAGVRDAKRTGFGLSAAYSLSNRTTVYGGVITARERDATIHPATKV